MGGLAMDPRITPFNGRVAHETLRGKLEAPSFTLGEGAQVSVSAADLRASSDGPRLRQLLFGDAFLVLERQEGFAFGQSQKDGYCGYISEDQLGVEQAVTHWVASPASHIYKTPKVQAPEVLSLSMGARLAVLSQGEKFFETPQGFVPKHHLRVLGNWHPDPVAVAQIFLGTPYLWGGNTRSGLDCSGLVQAALLACGMACPSDSDLQQSLGKSLADKAPLKRGDLLFWKGHVAMAINADVIIHANAASMSVVVENAKTAPTRILAAGGGPILARRRIF